MRNVCEEGGRELGTGPAKVVRCPRGVCAARSGARAVRPSLALTVLTCAYSVAGTGCLLPQLEEDESEEEEIEETRLQGRDNIPVYEKTVRCRSGSGWYNLNAKHTLNTTAQTLSSRVPPIDILIQVSSLLLIRRYPSPASFALAQQALYRRPMLLHAALPVLVICFGAPHTFPG